MPAALLVFCAADHFPEQLAERAAKLEMPAMALLDRNGVYGAQRFSVAAREKNVRPIIGCELTNGRRQHSAGAGGKPHRLQKSVRATDAGASAQ